MKSRKEKFDEFIEAWEEMKKTKYSYSDWYNQIIMSPKALKEFIGDPMLWNKANPRPNYRLREFKCCWNCFFCKTKNISKEHGEECICTITTPEEDISIDCVCDNHRSK